VRIKKAFLNESGEYIGPFESRKDAEGFIILMKLFGGSCEGITVVERFVESVPKRRKTIVNRANSALHQNCRD
jgi:hypothetical protein